MSVAYFIAVNKAPSDLDVYVNGKAIAKYSNFLERCSKELDIASLEDYVSLDPEEAASFISDHGGDLEGIEIPEEKWFSAEEGEKWVSTMINYIVNLENAPEELLSDLNEYQDLFKKLLIYDKKWHFEVDF